MESVWAACRRGSSRTSLDGVCCLFSCERLAYFSRRMSVSSRLFPFLPALNGRRRCRREAPSTRKQRENPKEALGFLRGTLLFHKAESVPKHVPGTFFWVSVTWRAGSFLLRNVRLNLYALTALAIGNHTVPANLHMRLGKSAGR